MKNRLLLLGLCACALACDSASPVAPSGTVLSISANPTQISLSGESSTITVTGFKPDGNSLNPGTQILIATDVGDLFHPQTGERVSIIEVAGNGQAVALLRGDGRTGSATVTATLTTGGEATATATVTIGETPESQPSLIISANPSTVAVLTTSLISILARAADGSALGADQRIRLTSDLGDLACEESFCDQPLAANCTAVCTDQNGEAQATFTAGDRGGTGLVSALLGTSEEVSVSIEIRAALNSLALTANPTSIQRLDAPGAQVALEAVLLDAQGEAVPSTLVIFDTPFGSLNNSSVLSNSQGVARAILTVTATDVVTVGEGASFTVTASATSEGETRGDSVDIVVQGAPNP